MSSRIRHESGTHIRKSSHTSLLKKTMDENKINQPNLNSRSTLGSSTKPTLPNTDIKPQTPALKPKSSRTVLASLTNATPRPKPQPTTKQSKAQAPSMKPSGVFKTPSAPKVRAHQTPGVKTPSAAPKSTKKAISVYTPARTQAPRATDENEVEYTHPKPAPLEDGPPSPLREAIEGRWTYTDTDDMGFDPLDLDLMAAPSSPQITSRGPLESPRHAELADDFNFDQADDYGL